MPVDESNVIEQIVHVPDSEVEQGGDCNGTAPRPQQMEHDYSEDLPFINYGMACGIVISRQQEQRSAGGDREATCYCRRSVVPGQALRTRSFASSVSAQVVHGRCRKSGNLWMSIELVTFTIGIHFL